MRTQERDTNNEQWREQKTNQDLKKSPEKKHSVLGAPVSRISAAASSRSERATKAWGKNLCSGCREIYDYYKRTARVNTRGAHGELCAHTTPRLA